MTTIAYKDGIIAFDTLIPSGNSDEGFAFMKVRRINDAIFAGSGSLGAIQHFFGWADEGMIKDTLKDQNIIGSYTIVMIPEKGPFKLFDEESKEWFVTKRRNSFGAIGTGAEYAIGAMDVGATSTEAVKSAIKFDLYTGGRIKTLEY